MNKNTKQTITEKPAPVSPELRLYVETQIFPRYEAIGGHGVSHIKDVIKRSLDFAERINAGEIKTTQEDFANLPSSLTPSAKMSDKIDYDIVYVVAAYHDLGRELNNKLHHLMSAALFLTDETMQKHFDREKLRVIADAIMDHRASNELDPMTIYGRIVSSADRDTDVKPMFRRAAAYFQHLYPDASDDVIVQRVCERLSKKFVGESAYAAKKMYFTNPAYDAALAEYNRMAADPTLFQTEAKKALAEIKNQ
ncbi:hypothetical protein IJ118_02915 [Candidatus Saccharibacteria bacterium]|nr:hypothetical protein [Candidatus Saccharibacteria bacterium]